MDPLNIISVGITWVDGRALFKDHERKWSKVWYGICHMSEGIWALMPLDWPKGKMIITLHVDIDANFCDYSDVCLNFECPVNKFTKEAYSKQFGTGGFSLGLPQVLTLRSKGKKLWFNDDKWVGVWGKFIIQGTGGEIKYDEKRAKEVLNL